MHKKVLNFAYELAASTFVFVFFLALIKIAENVGY